MKKFQIFGFDTRIFFSNLAVSGWHPAFYWICKSPHILLFSVYSTSWLCYLFWQLLEDFSKLLRRKLSYCFYALFNRHLKTYFVKEYWIFLLIYENVLLNACKRLRTMWLQVLTNILSTRGTIEQGACLDALISLLLDSSSNQMVCYSSLSPSPLEGFRFNFPLKLVLVRKHNP